MISAVGFRRVVIIGWRADCATWTVGPEEYSVFLVVVQTTLRSIMESEISSPLVQSGTGISPAAKEVVVGAAGGVTQVLIGQPFDIVKVRMQNRVGGGAVHIARNLWRQEGPRGFYKGSLAPFVGVGACISIVYTTFHLTTSALQSLQPQSQSHPNGALTTPQIYLSGGIAGLTNSLVSGPMEHIRIRLQMQSASPASTPGPGQGPGQGSSVSGHAGTGTGTGKYTGTVDCVRQIFRHGGLRALYRGQSATMLREFHSYGIWFAVYGGLMEWVRRDEIQAQAQHKPGPEPEAKQSEIPIPSWKIALCGALTGEILWAMNYPFDVLKSTMQADGFGSQRRHRGVTDAARHIWIVDGWRGFFRGLGPTLGRAVPVSAGTFLVVEAVRKAL